MKTRVFSNRSHAIESHDLFTFKPYFFCFPPATGITCCGGMCLFGLWHHLGHVQSTIFASRRILHLLSISHHSPGTLLYHAWPSAHHARIWRRRPNPGRASFRLSSVSLANSRRPCHSRWQGCHHYCSDRIREVFDLLDASASLCIGMYFWKYMLYLYTLLLTTESCACCANRSNGSSTIWYNLHSCTGDFEGRWCCRMAKLQRHKPNKCIPPQQVMPVAGGKPGGRRRS